MCAVSSIKNQARLIFDAALRAVDAGDAVRGFVKILDTSNLLVGDEIFDLKRIKVYSIALGKAAYPMALAIDSILGENLAGGVISGILPDEKFGKGFFFENKVLSDKWLQYAGGHPLPNEDSLKAAQSCFSLLRAANDQKSLVIFLVSGGGSAMLEMPADKSVTLTDLRETNRLLVSCGAIIAEINTVRQAFSLVKAGNLAAQAPHANQITLLISDTEPGDEASIASGPTFETASKQTENAKKIINRYNLTDLMPASILRLIEKIPAEKIVQLPEGLRRYHVLLDNQSAVEAALAAADDCGFIAETENRLSEQSVAAGCTELLRRATDMRRRTSAGRVVCLISGGEFSCPVKGAGSGGRNSETVLRMALMLEELNQTTHNERVGKEFVFLSAGTDGIDGNSPAAGAIADHTTLERVRKMNLNARHFLENSDAYTFFNLLGDAVVTGVTGTNVRDLRILILG